jgi:hypothetical protein
MVGLGRSEASKKGLLVGPWCSPSADGLLLEDVEDVDRARKRDGVPGPIGVAVVGLDKFHDGARQPLSEGTSPVWMISILSIQEGGSEDVLYLLRHGSQGLETGADEVKGFAFSRSHGVV